MNSDKQNHVANMQQGGCERNERTLRMNCLSLTIGTVTRHTYIMPQKARFKVSGGSENQLKRLLQEGRRMK